MFVACSVSPAQMLMTAWCRWRWLELWRCWECWVHMDCGKGWTELIGGEKEIGGSGWG